MGNPIGPADTDTIVQRTTGIDPFDFPSGVGTVSIELVSLSLVSVAPITISGTSYNLNVLGGTSMGIPQTPGTMTVLHNHPNGGTFSSTLPVTAKLIFTEVGNPGNKTETPFADTFTSTGGIWSHTPRWDDPHTPSLPAGNFHPGVHPDFLQKVLTLEEAKLAAHGVLPAQAVPEAATFSFFGLGLIGMGLLARKRPRR
jgi:hypothetical protein